MAEPLSVVVDFSYGISSRFARDTRNPKRKFRRTQRSSSSLPLCVYQPLPGTHTAPERIDLNMPLDSDAYKGAVVSEAVAKARAQRADESMVRGNKLKIQITWWVVPQSAPAPRTHGEACVARHFTYFLLRLR